MQILGIIGPWQLIIFIIVVLPFIILPIIALIDIIRSEFTGSNKIVWVLVVFFFPIIGSILYFMFGSNKKIKP